MCMDSLLLSSPQVKSFGYSCTLTKGTMIVAWWYMIAGLLDEIRIVWALSTMTRADVMEGGGEETVLDNLFGLVWLRPCTTPTFGLLEEITSVFAHGNRTVTHQQGSAVKEDEYDDDEIDDYRLAARLICGGIFTAIVLTTTLFAIILLNGVTKNNLNKVKCWTKVHITLWISTVITTLISMIVSLVMEHMQWPDEIGLKLIVLGINFYCILVVKSYYAECQYDQQYHNDKPVDVTVVKSATPAERQRAQDPQNNKEGGGINPAV